jgi:hypothetical protein
MEIDHGILHADDPCDFWAAPRILKEGAWRAAPRLHASSRARVGRNAYTGGSRVSGHPWPARDEHILCSLADAEGGKDRAEQVVGGELAGDFVERALHVAQFLGSQFAGAQVGECMRGGVEVGLCASECGDVARACAECAVAGVAGAGVAPEFCDEPFKAVARACGEPDVGDTVANLRSRLA